MQYNILYQFIIILCIFNLQERLTELRDLGCEPTLSMLCKNKTTYQELVHKLILKNTTDLKNI